jgi:hypothetical protein
VAASADRVVRVVARRVVSEGRVARAVLVGLALNADRVVRAAPQQP